MRHYHNHTEGFEKDWKLIRETASSQKFRVTTEKTKIEVDIHYTAEKITLQPANAENSAENGPSVDSIKAFIDPVISLLAYILYIFVSTWDYIIKNPPAAILLSAGIAFLIAVKTINTTRSITRLRETFYTLNAANWNRDIIAARKVYAELLRNVGDDTQSIAKYCHGSVNLENFEETERTKHEDICNTLLTILNEYEIISLGVRLYIIDEDFLYKSLRGTTLRDWKQLTPLVTEFRRRYSSQVLYIEFEALVNACGKEYSYRTGKKMIETRKYQFFR